MRGILFERGKWLNVSRAKVTDTQLELTILKIDVLTVGLRVVQVSFVDKNLAEEIRELCSTWARESQTFNPQLVVGSLAQEILSLIYRARISKRPVSSAKSPNPHVSA